METMIPALKFIFRSSKNVMILQKTEKRGKRSPSTKSNSKNKAQKALRTFKKLKRESSLCALTTWSRKRVAQKLTKEVRRLRDMTPFKKRSLDLMEMSSNIISWIFPSLTILLITSHKMKSNAIYLTNKHASVNRRHFAQQLESLLQLVEKENLVDVLVHDHQVDVFLDQQEQQQEETEQEEIVVEEKPGFEGEVGLDLLIYLSSKTR